MRRALLLAFVLVGLASACHSPDPKQVLELADLETYWAIDSSRGDKVYIAPVARFYLENKSQEPVRSIQASAAFRRKGEEDVDWGAGFQEVTPAQKPLLPGQRTLVVLKSDGHYYSTGAPEAFFESTAFKDARAHVYVRIGSSPWVLFAEADVDRRIGTKTLQSPSP